MQPSQAYNHREGRTYSSSRVFIGPNITFVRCSRKHANKPRTASSTFLRPFLDAATAAEQRAQDVRDKRRLAPNSTGKEGKGAGGASDVVAVEISNGQHAAAAAAPVKVLEHATETGRSAQQASSSAQAESKPAATQAIQTSAVKTETAGNPARQPTSAASSQRHSKRAPEDAVAPKSSFNVSASSASVSPARGADTDAEDGGCPVSVLLMNLDLYNSLDDEIQHECDAQLQLESTPPPAVAPAAAVGLQAQQQPDQPLLSSSAEVLDADSIGSATAEGAKQNEQQKRLSPVSAAALASTAPLPLASVPQAVAAAAVAAATDELPQLHQQISAGSVSRPYSPTLNTLSLLLQLEAPQQLQTAVMMAASSLAEARSPTPTGSSSVADAAAAPRSFAPAGSTGNTAADEASSPSVVSSVDAAPVRSPTPAASRPKPAADTNVGGPMPRVFATAASGSAALFAPPSQDAVGREDAASWNPSAGALTAIAGAAAFALGGVLTVKQHVNAVAAILHPNTGGGAAAGSAAGAAAVAHGTTAAQGIAAAKGANGAAGAGATAFSGVAAKGAVTATGAGTAAKGISTAAATGAIGKGTTTAAAAGASTKAAATAVAAGAAQTPVAGKSAAGLFSPVGVQHGAAPGVQAGAQASAAQPAATASAQHASGVGSQEAFHTSMSAGSHASAGSSQSGHVAYHPENILSKIQLPPGMSFGQPADTSATVQKAAEHAANKVAAAASTPAAEPHTVTQTVKAATAAAHSATPATAADNLTDHFTKAFSAAVSHSSAVAESVAATTAKTAAAAAASTHVQTGAAGHVTAAANAAAAPAKAPLSDLYGHLQASWESMMSNVASSVKEEGTAVTQQVQHTSDGILSAVSDLHHGMLHDNGLRSLLMGIRQLGDSLSRGMDEAWPSAPPAIKLVAYLAAAAGAVLLMRRTAALASTSEAGATTAWTPSNGGNAAGPIQRASISTPGGVPAMRRLDKSTQSADGSAAAAAHATSAATSAAQARLVAAATTGSGGRKNPFKVEKESASAAIAGTAPAAKQKSKNGLLRFTDFVLGNPKEGEQAKATSAATSAPCVNGIATVSNGTAARGQAGIAAAAAAAATPAKPVGMMSRYAPPADVVEPRQTSAKKPVIQSPASTWGGGPSAASMQRGKPTSGHKPAAAATAAEAVAKPAVAATAASAFMNATTDIALAPASWVAEDDAELLQQRRELKESLGWVTLSMGVLPAVLPTGEPIRVDIDKLIRKLEELDPAAKEQSRLPSLVSQNSAQKALAGDWKLIYASNEVMTGPSTLLAKLLRLVDSLPGFGMRQIEQKLQNMAQRGGVGSNVVVAENSAIFRFGPLGTWQISLQGLWEENGAGSCALAWFESFALKPVHVLGLSTAGAGTVQVAIPSALQAPTQWCTTYLDHDMRVNRSDAGSLYLFKRNTH